MSEAHEALVEHLRRLHALERAGEALRWDQETAMPPGGVEARAGEIARLATLLHEGWTSEETGRRIEAARSRAETGPERALVREAARIRERRVRVPEELVEEISETTSRAHAAWVEAKRAGDFATFADPLERIVELKRAYAEAIAPERGPYAVLFADFEPWLDLDRALAVVDEVAQQARDLLARAPDPDAQAPANALEGPWPEDTQRALLRELLTELGFDFDRGGLGEAEHPFSTGNVHDARIATNLRAGNLLESLLPTIHEFGHALYTQGLPEDAFGTPAGDDRGLVVHESQARLWENHVGRSRAFWELLADPIEERFGRELDVEAAWRAANVVQPSPIRVDADEVSYHLHVKLRLALERRLVAGDLAVDELPTAWNEGMEELLGIRPETDREGVLQDIHWSHGSIGYFPTYTLGSALAAQLEAALEDALGPLVDLVRERAFGDLVAWLRDNVHRHGCRHRTGDLIEEATGAPLGAKAWVEHVEGRFERVWAEV